MRPPSAPPSAGADRDMLPPVDDRLTSAWLTQLQYRWDELTQGKRSRILAKDETLFLEGQAADTVYVILQGRVRLTTFGFDGKERHLLIIGPSGLVGDCALRCTRRYTVSAVAATDSVVALVPAATMLSALVHDPRMAAQQQHLSGLRFRILFRHVAVQGANASRRRVCTHQLDLIHSYGAPHRFGQGISITFTWRR